MLYADKYFVLEDKSLQFLFSGECQITHPSNIEGISKMDYEIGLTKNGTMVGTLQLLLKEHTNLQIIQNTFKSTFSEKGHDNRTGLQIIMENCLVRQHQLEPSNKISCILISFDVILHDKRDDTVLGNILVHFGLMNVFNIRRTNYKIPNFELRRNDKVLLKVEPNKFIFQTKLGELEFYNYDNIDMTR